MNKKELMLNMIANIMSFALNTIISFFLTSFIVEQIGETANGFIKLSTDFTNYATLITIAINSMATRYIMISLERNQKNAKKYYNSVIIANIVLSIVLLIPSIIVVLFCDTWLDIPANMLLDVKLNFLIVFLNFIINLLFTTTGQVYYLTNKLYINSVVTMLSTAIRAVILVILFYFAGTKITYVSVATLIATIFLIIVNVYYRKKLLPDLCFDISAFEWGKVKELLASGIWNSITRLSQLFTSGLDLLLSNMLLDAAKMGILSVAKTVPNMITTFLGTLANIFSPNLTQLYALGKMEDLKNSVKYSMRIMCVFTSIPNAILVSIGMQFYTLWTPSLPAREVQILAILTVINSVITGVLQPIYSIITITNKVKQNSFVMIIYGICSVLITVFLLKTTQLGVYAIAGVSLIGSLIVAVFYHIPKGAQYLDLPTFTFVPEIILSVVSFVIITVIGFGISLIIDAGKSWINWFGVAIIIGVIGLVVNLFLVLKKSERAQLIEQIKSKLKGIVKC